MRIIWQHKVREKATLPMTDVEPQAGADLPYKLPISRTFENSQKTRLTKAHTRQ
jgi:hypothetical protein